MCHFRRPPVGSFLFQTFFVIYRSTWKVRIDKIAWHFGEHEGRGEGRAEQLFLSCDSFLQSPASGSLVCIASWCSVMESLMITLNPLGSHCALGHGASDCLVGTRLSSLSLVNTSHASCFWACCDRFLCPQQGPSLVFRTSSSTLFAISNWTTQAPRVTVPVTPCLIVQRFFYY